ncbi:MAG: inverse autotransporter beta domain-containing protein [Planctomycetaceae bacterium]|nr:inverse autotransporter beta domain-containing protein [Planctomycetaceae bacterium]
MAVVLSISPSYSEAGGPPQTLDVTGVGGEYMSHSPDGGGAGPEFEIPGGGYGFLSRIGHIAGETVGRDDSITHVGLAPYVFHEETMLFGDLRLFRTNEGRTGGSAGMGLRHYLTEQDAILGIAGYYDSDDSRGAIFKQVGASFEYLTRMFDVRANVYVPIETTERVIGTSIVPDSERFSGNSLLFDGRTDFAAAANGADLMISTPVPGEIPEMFNLEVSGGGYHYQARQDGLTDMWGYKLRTDADVFKRVLHMFLELTSDRVTDTNLVFGASLNYYHGFENKRRLHDRQFYRMSEWVRRNFTVVTIDDFAIDAGQEARNPDTGDPYFFAHVRNIPGNSEPPPLPATLPATDFNFPSPFGDGTVEMPFQFIQEGQAAVRALPLLEQPNGIVYVHGNSQFEGAASVIEMLDGETLLGEGEGSDVQQTLAVVGFTDEAELPFVIPDGAVPLLNTPAGDAVTLASGNTFAGFDILDGAGNGITINSGMGGTIRDVNITNVAGDGVLMTTPSETFLFDRVSINNATGVGFHIDGGTAVTTFTDSDRVTLGMPSIVNASNEALLIENTTGGSNIFANAIIDDNDGGSGLRLINNMGTITLGRATIDGTVLSSDPTSVGAGLEITGAAANTTLQGDITITNSSGVGFLVKDLVDGGVVRPSALLTINQRNNIGADFVNIDGDSTAENGVRFSSGSSLIIGALNGATADHPAIRFSSGSSGTVSLNEFSIADSLGAGILIGDPTGANVNEPGAEFRVIRDTINTINATGSIVTPDMAGGTSGPAIHIAGADGLEDPTNVIALGAITSNTRVGRGLQIEETTGSILFSDLTINNNASIQSTASALFINNTSSTISFGTFEANENAGLEPAVDIMNIVDPGSVRFSELNILDADGVLGLKVTDTSTLTVGSSNPDEFSGTIDVNDQQAIDIQRTEIDVTLNSVSSSNSPTYGISVVDSPGNFSIVGDRTGGGRIFGTDIPSTSSGGEISGAAIAGARFKNTGIVDLQGQDYTDNLVGVWAKDMNDDSVDPELFRLRLSTMQFIDNINQGILTKDVRNILIFNSVFRDGDFLTPADLAVIAFADPALTEAELLMDFGLTLDDRADLDLASFDNNQYIDLRLSENLNSDLVDPLNTADPDYVRHFWTIRHNTFSDTAQNMESDAVVVRTVDNAASDADLEFRFDGNGTADSGNVFFNFDRVISGGESPSALRVDWDGRLFADVSDNVLTMSGEDDQIGFNFITEGNDTFSEIGVNRNTIVGGDGIDTDNSIGIRFDLAGPNEVAVVSNIIDIRTPAVVDAIGNVNLDNDDIGLFNRGIEFQSRNGRSNVSIRQNIILMDAGTAVDVGQISTPGLGLASVFEFSGNLIGSDGNQRLDILDPDLRVSDRGLRISGVTGPLNLVGGGNQVFLQIFGLSNTQISNNVFSLSPAGSAGGFIEINGINYPLP